MAPWPQMLAAETSAGQAHGLDHGQIIMKLVQTEVSPWPLMTASQPGSEA